MGERTTLLLDSNVWVDYYCPMRPRHRAAFELIDKAESLSVDLMYAALSRKDVFYLLAMRYKREAREANVGILAPADAHAAAEVAWDCIKHMSECAFAVGCDASDIWIADKQKPLHADYEDNLIIAAALRSKADVLVTGDDVLRRHAPVCTMSVEDAMRFLDTLQ